MAIIRTGNRTHDDACNTAEAVRQAAVVPGASQSTVRTAEITYYRACLASAKANNLSTYPFVRALMDLGTGGA